MVNAPDSVIMTQFSSAFINKEVISDLSETHYKQSRGDKSWISVA